MVPAVLDRRPPRLLGASSRPGRRPGTFVLRPVALLALLLLSGTLSGSLCGPAAAAGARARREDPRKVWAADLEAFFQEMDATYPFFDLKGIRSGWPREKKRLAARLRRCRSEGDFLVILVDALKYLRDGHIGIVEAKADFPKQDPEFYPGVSFLPATEDRVVVMGARSPLDQVLKPGTVVTHIDRKPARAWLEMLARKSWEAGGFFSSPQRARLYEYRIPMRGKRGDKHKVTYLQGRRRKTVDLVCVSEAQGWPHHYHLPEGLTTEGRSSLWGRLESGVGYIYLRRIDGSVLPAIRKALKAHPDAKGWIVDLRGNAGGGYDEELIRQLAEIPRPVAGLIDAGCFSAGETFARDLVHQAGARLFGRTTAGSSTSKRRWELPSGLATFTLPTRSRYGVSIGGKRRLIEFHGIDPDVVVEAVPEEVAAGKNSAILRAEAWIRGEAGGDSGASSSPRRRR